MFDRLFSKFADIGTIKTLCEAAERHALADGQSRPGAEHFVLAALDLPDGSAAGVFVTLGIDAEKFRDALAGETRQALAQAGVSDVHAEATTPLPAQTGLYGAAPSGQAVMQALTQDRNSRDTLRGVDVLKAVATMSHGKVARTFQLMGITLAELQAAAR